MDTATQRYEETMQRYEDADARQLQAEHWAEDAWTQKDEIHGALENYHLGEKEIEALFLMRQLVRNDRPSEVSIMPLIGICNQLLDGVEEAVIDYCAENMS